MPREPAPVVIFTVGNESRGDDALGPVLLRKLGIWINATDRSEGFELIETYQLQIENALDMRGRELVMFIDAGVNQAAPFVFRRVEAMPFVDNGSHALAPASVVAVYGKIFTEPVPPAFLLCVCGAQFELGQPMSEAAQLHLAAAFEFAQQLASDANEREWSRRMTV